MRHLLEIDDLSSDDLLAILGHSEQPEPDPVLAGRGVALLFAKPSARTRSSMEMAVAQLGGHPVTIRGEEVGFDVRETVEDIGRTLTCYHAAIGARVFEHQLLERLAAASGVPVVNLLSDDAHPLQALADLLTIRQCLGGLAGRRLAYVGDANNVARSLGLACGLVGMGFRIASPDGFGFAEEDLDRLRATGCEPMTTNQPDEAVSGADVVYTDVWASMGQEDQIEDRRRTFAGFTVDDRLMALAQPESIFLHCLPAHRGEEVSAEVADGPRSRIWEQAENRMHTARGLLLWMCQE
ncbi:MAG: Ornithine carbamoyltransferase [Acidimicrobiales bacterium]|nr:MAG: ornithine carbamoyltransferase [Actinomycetota bacterium]MBV6507110.1 Ornithine carbamoyltransferase [Acidimicrobiales bacterium]RIK05587.1 MAG: ornithine carbamoyltransferase [Acidobacteriota bacterium]